MEYGLIGLSLKHSFSKEIHEKIGHYPYELKELNEKEFIVFMKKKEFKGINVTIPYKEKVIDYLDYISPEAKEIQAVNTIINHNGKLYGYNTDYLGLKEMLSYFQIPIMEQNVMILGSGGTSKTALKVCKDLKAKAITIVSRNRKENSITYNDLNLFYDSAHIIINTTPCEMYPNNQQKMISLQPFKVLKGVVDVIYNPLRTNLILESKKKNLLCCNGLYMLIAQAFYASQLFLNKTLDKSILSQFYTSLTHYKENIVLTGMPSSGKTTIGKLLSKIYQRDFYDVDDEIEKKVKMDIPTFFEKFGEVRFREIESEIIDELSKKNHIVIATGGGSILKESNISYLKQNGRIYFLDCSLKRLIATSSRPLSSTPEKLKKLFEDRYLIYKKTCDVRIDANQSIEDIILQIKGSD